MGKCACGDTTNAYRERVIFVHGTDRFATLNIRLGRAGGIETELWALRQGDVYVGVLQETKLTNGINMR